MKKVSSKKAGRSSSSSVLGAPMSSDQERAYLKGLVDKIYNQLALVRDGRDDVIALYESGDVAQADISAAEAAANAVDSMGIARSVALQLASNVQLTPASERRLWIPEAMVTSVSSLKDGIDEFQNSLAFNPDTNFYSPTSHAILLTTLLPAVGDLYDQIFHAAVRTPPPAFVEPSKAPPKPVYTGTGWQNTQAQASVVDPLRVIQSQSFISPSEQAARDSADEAIKAAAAARAAETKRIADKIAAELAAKKAGVHVDPRQNPYIDITPPPPSESSMNTAMIVGGIVGALVGGSAGFGLSKNKEQYPTRIGIGTVGGLLAGVLIAHLTQKSEATK